MYFGTNDVEEQEFNITPDEAEDDDEAGGDSAQTQQQLHQQLHQQQQQPTQQTAAPTTTTRSGRVVRPAPRLIEEMESVQLDEIMAVGAGIGGGFTHTSELRPLKYDEVMAGPKAKQWGESIDMEHDRMTHHAVFKAVKKKDVPTFAKILTSTWNMKQKADGTLRARVVARGFEQRPGEHYEETGMSSITSGE